MYKLLVNNSFRASLQTKFKIEQVTKFVHSIKKHILDIKNKQQQQSNMSRKKKEGKVT